MRYLIDTNIFVYLMDDLDCLNKDVRAIIEDFDNTICISVESLKELIVAYRTKGLCSNIWKTEKEMIDTIIRGNIVILPIRAEHMSTYAVMQVNEAQDHRDPSDHVIIAQALTEHLSLISSDAKFPFYRKQGLDLIENLK